MNKNTKRIVASLLALNLTLIPIFADAAPANTAVSSATEVSKQTYTYEKAAELAIKQNFELKTSDVDRAKLGRQIDDTLNSVNSMAFNDHLTATDKKDSTDPLIDNLTQMRNNVASMDDNTALKRATLKDTIKTLFVTIDKSEIQLKSLNEQIALDEKVIQSDRVKVKLGLLSSYDLEKNYNSNLKNIRTRDALIINISKLYDSLKNFMGVDTKANIALDYSFIDQYGIIMPGYESGLTKMNGGNLKLSAYSSDLSRAKNFKTVTQGRSNSSSADNDLDKAQLTYDNAVKELPYKFEAAYNDVKDAYQGYFQKQRELEIKKLDLKNGKVKLKLGRMSQLAYTTLETEVRTMEYDLMLSRIGFVSACMSLESTINGTN